MIRKRVLFILIAVLCIVQPLVSEKRSINTMEGIEYYDTAAIKKDARQDHLDVGRVVFLFQKKPVVNYVPSLSNNNKAVFVFPLVDINAISSDVINKINGTKNQFYSLRLESIKTPIKGLKLVISYDPTKVSFDHRIFKTISSKNGVEFRFHNQWLINTLRKRLSSSMRVSSIKKKISCH